MTEFLVARSGGFWSRARIVWAVLALVTLVVTGVGWAVMA